MLKSVWVESRAALWSWSRWWYCTWLGMWVYAVQGTISVWRGYQAWYGMIQKVQTELEKLPTFKAALQLHLAYANFQARLWLQSYVSMKSIRHRWLTRHWWWSYTGGLFNTLLNPWCMCWIASCKCSKNAQRCIPVCTCNAENCINPTGLDYIKHYMNIIYQESHETHVKKQFQIQYDFI